MVNKILGYALFAGGIVVSALSYPSIRTLVNVKLPEISGIDTILLVAGIALIFAGAYFSFGGSSKKKIVEVPVIEGQGKNQKVVGYRRIAQ